jgi:hypothetical protein
LLFRIQLIDFPHIALLLGLFDLVTELTDVAVGLRLGLVAADSFDDLLGSRHFAQLFRAFPLGSFDALGAFGV